jgi:hypothetical protein
MRNSEFKEKLPLQNGAKFPFNELLEREKKSCKSLEEMHLEDERKFHIHERIGNSRSQEKIISVGGRPFAIICPLITHAEDYVEHEIPKIADQLDKYALTVPGALATKYKFDSDDITEITNDAAYVRYYATKHIYGAIYSHKWTSKGEELLYGTGSSVSGWPEGVDVSTPPTNVQPGIIGRYRIKAQRMKAMKNLYTITDGQEMGIEAGHTSIDPSLAKPFLRWDLVAGGHPELKYVKSIYDGAEFQKNWSDGKGMVALDKPTKPSLTDMSTLPAVGASALWGYQAIYLLDDKRTGSFCDVLWITVKGV